MCAAMYGRTDAAAALIAAESARRGTTPCRMTHYRVSDKLSARRRRTVYVHAQGNGRILRENERLLGRVRGGSAQGGGPLSFVALLLEKRSQGTRSPRGSSGRKPSFGSGLGFRPPAQSTSALSSRRPLPGCRPHCWRSPTALRSEVSCKSGGHLTAEARRHAPRGCGSD